MKTDMTVWEFVKQYFPDVNVSEAGRLMMNCTSYPCGDMSNWEESLQSISEQTQDVDDALTIAVEEIDKAFEEYKKWENENS